jgi:hypothetical protein
MTICQMVSNNTTRLLCRFLANRIKEKFSGISAIFGNSIILLILLKRLIFNMMSDWKKTEKKFYLPKQKPELIRIPPFKFFSIAGQGDPNEKPFAENISVLYSLSYAVKMAPKKGLAPKDYSDYKVYPLEGQWDLAGEAKKMNSDTLDKNSFVYNLMIRQPDFVTNEYALETIERVKKSKPNIFLDKVKFEIIEDSDCIQMMHVGSYDDEPISFRQMENFCKENNFTRVSGQHREIYLSDFRKVSPDKLRTVLRFKVNI